MIELFCIIAALWYSTEYDRVVKKRRNNHFRLTSGAAVWRPVVMRRLSTHRGVMSQLAEAL